MHRIKIVKQLIGRGAKRNQALFALRVNPQLHNHLYNDIEALMTKYIFNHKDFIANILTGFFQCQSVNGNDVNLDLYNKLESIYSAYNQSANSIAHYNSQLGELLNQRYFKSFTSVNEVSIELNEELSKKMLETIFKGLDAIIKLLPTLQKLQKNVESVKAEGDNKQFKEAKNNRQKVSKHTHKVDGSYITFFSDITPASSSVQILQGKNNVESTK